MLSSQILVLQEPDGTVHRVEVGPSPVMLGRGSDAEVAIMAPTVSRHHAVLRGHHGEVWVEDVGSKSGSRLNGEPLQSARRIRPGDTLELGGVRLKVRYGLDPTALAMPNHDRSPALPWPTVVPAVRTPADPVRFTIEGQSGATINNVGRDHVFVQQVQQRAAQQHAQQAVRQRQQAEERAAQQRVAQQQRATQQAQQRHRAGSAIAQGHPLPRPHVHQQLLQQHGS